MARFMNRLQIDKEACLTALEKIQDVEQAMDYLEIKSGQMCKAIRDQLRYKLGSIVDAIENGAK